tara:strand:- start:10 stop:345 length:336 start_codon:yes stop_codon:yes gene_type:complete
MKKQEYFKSNHEYIKGIIDCADDIDYDIIDNDVIIYCYSKYASDTWDYSFSLNSSYVVKNVDHVREYWNDGMQQDIDQKEINYNDNPELFEFWDIIDSFLNNLDKVNQNYD